jgi:SH3 domain-containing YSC84-like protein 1
MKPPFTSRRKLMPKVMPVMLALALAALSIVDGNAQSKETERLETCGLVLQEILKVPDDIPTDLMDKSECVIVIPSVIKAALGIGGSYGRGSMTCRGGASFSGPWSAPTMIALEGGSFGFQLGGQATDFVILVMNPRGATAIMNNKVKLGADAAAAAGPKGRNAQAATDVTLRAEMLTYSRSRGLFAGVSLEGSTLRPDNNANEEIYGKKVDAKEIVQGGAVPVPASAQTMVSLLTQHSPKNLSDPVSLQ